MCHAVFICYAMDKDTHSVTNAEVHEVFSQVRLPSWLACTVYCLCLIHNSLPTLWTSMPAQHRFYFKMQRIEMGLMI